MGDQESRTDRVSVAVTPTEKDLLDLVAKVHRDRFDGISNVIRELSFSDALAEGKRLMARLREETTAA